MNHPLRFNETLLYPKMLFLSKFSEVGISENFENPGIKNGH